MVWAVLDDRLPSDAARLDKQLMSRGLSPHPSLLLALEGKTEMLIMPRVMAEFFGAPVPDRLVECVFMDTVTPGSGSAGPTCTRSSVRPGPRRLRDTRAATNSPPGRG